jgi:exodeoxyribonuclease V alpha subunit
MSAVDVDPFDARRVRSAPPLLAAFNAAGVLSPADVHVARRLGALGGEEDETVLLAAALAVRAPRVGHVRADLRTVRETTAVDGDEPVDVSGLPWPAFDAWRPRVAASPLVAAGEAGAAPFRLLGDALYLDRYWREERQVAADIAARSASPADGVDPEVLAGGLARVFASTGHDRSQRLAAAAAVLRRFAVVAGGPGTGKTTTVARIVALLAEQHAAAGTAEPLVALAAPTGKAANRLEEAVRGEAAKLDRVEAPVQELLLALEASTLHKLLGWRPGSHSRFRHDKANRLPHDVVIVDESSMVSISLMARLVEAVRPDARLILVGDPGQLRSVEAGAVLGDIVGPAADGLVMRAPARAALTEATGMEVAATEPAAGVGTGDGIVVLDRVHRFGRGIAAVAEAIRHDDADAVVAALRAGAEDVRWIEADPAAPESAAALRPVRDAAVTAGREVMAAARAGDAAGAIAALASCRILCAHRRGPYGVSTWTGRVEGWLAAGVPRFAAEGAWYVGRPLLVTENDYGLKLWNGDTGVVVAVGEDRVSAAFERHGALLEFTPTRLEAVETVHAMTVHKAQGSQFGTAAVLLPDPTSPLLTRELLYTAVTRAQQRLVLAATEETIRTAVARPAARASGLLERLWNGGGADHP